MAYSRLGKGAFWWIKKRQDFRCYYCGRPESEVGLLTRDHRVPRSRGGKTNVENTVAACLACNQDKANTMPGDR